MKALALVFVAAAAFAAGLTDEETATLRDMVISEGPEAVIGYIAGFDLAQRVELYELARETYIFDTFPGEELDDLVAIADCAIEDMLREAREADDTLVRMMLLDQANVFSYNLSADLAECWPGDTLTRYPRHFERGLSAALQCLEWRYFLEKLNYPFFLAHWAAGMHQLSLGMNEQALYNMVRSMNYAEQITADNGIAIGFYPGAGFELLLAHGYYGLALLQATGDPSHFDRTIEHLEAGIEQYPDWAEDYTFAMEQLLWTRQRLESR
jgi:hypothetical protein